MRNVFTLINVLARKWHCDYFFWKKFKYVLKLTKIKYMIDTYGVFTILSSSWLDSLLKGFLDPLFHFLAQQLRQILCYLFWGRFTHWQLPQGVFAGCCPVSSCVVPGSGTSPTECYNIIPSNISQTVKWHV